jgi:hypothetical protein
MRWTATLPDRVSKSNEIPRATPQKFDLQQADNRFRFRNNLGLTRAGFNCPQEAMQERLTPGRTGSAGAINRRPKYRPPSRVVMPQKRGSSTPKIGGYPLDAVAIRVESRDSRPSRFRSVARSASRGPVPGWSDPGSVAFRCVCFGYQHVSAHIPIQTRPGQNATL